MTSWRSYRSAVPLVSAGLGALTPIDDASEDGYGRFYTVTDAGDSLARRAMAGQQ